MNEKLKLDSELTTLSGSNIMLTPNKALTYRTAFVSACETYQGEPGSGDTLKAYHLGSKVLGAKDDLKSFTEEEIKTLTKIVEGNKAFMAVVVGRLLDFINNSN